MLDEICGRYSLEQLQTLQRAKAAQTPLDSPLCVSTQRIAFIENAAKRDARFAKLRAQGKRCTDATGPSHANYITYIGPHVEAFRRVFQQFGKVTSPK